MRSLAHVLITAWLVLFVSTTAKADHSLWRVESSEGRLFLQGSVHLLKKEHYPLPQAVEDAFQQSECLVLEVDLQDMIQPDQQRRVSQMSVLPHGDNLRQAVGSRIYARLRDALPALKVPLGYFDRSKPWFVAMSLTRIRLAQLGFDPSLGLDAHFYARAKESGKPVHGLETLEGQLRLLDGLPSDVQRDMLSQTLTELSTIEEEVERIVSAWSSGDMASLERHQLTKFRRHPQVYDALIRQRNLDWMGKIDGYLSSGKTCLVVVGAAHLAGPDGLVRALKHAGYTLTQY